MIDIVTPGFQKKVKRGEVFFNPMTSNEYTYQETGQGWEVHSVNTFDCSGVATTWDAKWDGPIVSQGIDGILNTKTGGLDSPQLILDADIKLTEKEVSTRVLSQRGRSDSNLFESLAEFDQTLNLLNLRFSKLFPVVKRLAQSPQGVITGTANAWLTWRYGISPILSDVENIMKGWNARVGRKRITTRASESMNAFQSSPNFLGFGIGTVKTEVNRKTDDHITIRGMSLDEMVATFAFNIGFSEKGLVTLPWELVSYSFVADWFLNIGDMLGALIPSSGLTQLGSCLVTKRDVKSTWQTGLSIPATTGNVLFRATDGYYISIQRATVRKSLAAPGLVVRNDFRFDKIRRVADAAALLSQRFLSLHKTGARIR